ncbi:MAG TPA: HD-GYP domain-containing protein [Burkholderiaceae bacterium]|nr:HD-GYP domain-containing protein [Burkholderiaceae bacterium]
MLKRISVQQLTIGMYLEEFCGTWMEHPFWRTSFVLNDPKDLERIRATSIQEVWIDCSKGLDIPAGEKAVTKAEVEAVVESELGQLGEDVPPLEPVSLAQEIERAASICAKSKQAVMSMFHEIRLGHAVDSASAQQLVAEISDSVARNPGALISLARLKTADEYTYMHSVAVCALMVALARQLGLDEDQTRLAGIAGLLHDLGKMAMPLTILNKPGKLTDEEFTVIRNHPVEGYRMLLVSSKVDDAVLDAVLHHHEKSDGSGYPQGLKAEQISLFARMAAVCDVYDAITSNRPYKAGWDPADSLRKMAEWASGHFDVSIFQAFVKSIGIYPVGSLLRLSSGRLGVVIEQGEKSLMTPRVKVFYSTHSDLRIVPEVVDLARPGCTEKIVAREDPAKWHFPDLHHMWSGLQGQPW